MDDDRAVGSMRNGNAGGMENVRVVVCGMWYVEFWNVGMWYEYGMDQVREG